MHRIGAWSLGVCLVGVGTACGSAPQPAVDHGHGAADHGQGAVESPLKIAVRPLAIQSPEASDAVPLFELSLLHADGSKTVVREPASAYAPFRDGVALIDRARRLLLVSVDGTERVVAARSSTAPARGPAGELIYVADYGDQVELHRLTVGGEDRVIARELHSAGLLAPQADGSVLLVGAPNGGVAGIWRVAPEADRARCLTNCTLRTAQAWKDPFEPPPGTVAQLQDRYRALRQQGGASVPEATGGALGGEP